MHCTHHLLAFCRTLSPVPQKYSCWQPPVSTYSITLSAYRCVCTTAPYPWRDSHRMFFLCLVSTARAAAFQLASAKALHDLALMCAVLTSQAHVQGASARGSAVLQSSPGRPSDASGCGLVGGAAGVHATPGGSHAGVSSTSGGPAQCSGSLVAATTVGSRVAPAVSQAQAELALTLASYIEDKEAGPSVFDAVYISPKSLLGVVVYIVFTVGTYLYQDLRALLH